MVVLGSGWGAVSFIKNLDPEAFGGERHAVFSTAASRRPGAWARPPARVQHPLVVPAGGALLRAPSVLPRPAADGPYELVVVSPRNYMLYTPLLPSESQTWAREGRGLCREFRYAWTDLKAH